MLIQRAGEQRANVLTLACSLLLFVSLLVSSGLLRGQRVPSSELEKPTWSPIIEMDNQIFPSLALSLASINLGNPGPSYIGDPAGLLGIAVASPQPGVRVKVTIRVDGLSDQSSLDATLPKASTKYTIYPHMRFDVQALARTRESHATTAVFSVEADGASLGQETRTVQVRSVNDVPLAYRNPQGKLIDLKGALFASFVDENSPLIDRILSEALKDNAIQQFRGYQGPPEEVLHQVFAVWNVLQRRGVRYSNIAQPSLQSQTIPSQHVRFIDETYQNSEANCVDGTALFASVLYKLGIYPLLVLKPAHMFLGFYLDPQKKMPEFLETTLIGSPGLDPLQKWWTFKTREGYKNSESYRQFMAAVRAGDIEMRGMVGPLKGGERGYSIVDVDQMRHVGIAAIPRL